MSLWADYINECEILNIIEHDWGFITFHLMAPNILFINDCYVAPKSRRKGLGIFLFKEASEYGLKYGCEWLKMTIHKHSLCAEETKRVAQSYDFTVYAEDDTFYYVSKEIGGLL